MVLRSGRYGPYVTEEPPEGAEEKPRTASLFASHVAGDGRRSTPPSGCSRFRGSWRVDDGEEVLAMNGRYGPYIKRGTETRSLESEEQLFTVDLDEALALLAAPKTARRPGSGEAAAAGAGPGSLVRAFSRGQGRPIWTVRNGWGDEREPALRGRG